MDSNFGFGFEDDDFDDAVDANAKSSHTAAKQEKYGLSQSRVCTMDEMVGPTPCLPRYRSVIIRHCMRLLLICATRSMSRCLVTRSELRKIFLLSPFYSPFARLLKPMNSFILFQQLIRLIPIALDISVPLYVYIYKSCPSRWLDHLAPSAGALRH